MSLEYRIAFGMFNSISPDKIIEKWKQNLTKDILFKCSDNADHYVFFAHGSIRGVSVGVAKMSYH